MMDFDNFESSAPTRPLSQTDKAAAVLLAMGKGVAGKLLKFFTQSELQGIIAAAQSLRSIPPHELDQLVSEFEDLFTEGAGLMDNAKAIEAILEEGLPPDEVDGLLGRRAAFQAYEQNIWDRLQDSDPVFVSRYIAKEHPQTIAYVLSMMPSGFSAKVLLELPESQRADIMNRTVTMKNVSPKAAQIIEQRVIEMVQAVDEERNSTGSVKAADLINQLEKTQVDSLLGALESLSQESASKIRPKIFLFDDIMLMPQRSRVQLFNDVSGDIITMALRGAAGDLRECVLSALGARQRRMIESDLGSGEQGINPRDIAIARRSITQEAIRLAAAGMIELKEKTAA
ncbi:flagellar motor switch protein FliG [Rhizobium rhizosphaerae]|uniref:Flagellar motor switch protein FliG n=1 Tax=Xaviernesmea rhizosphaerae TaxID=1672749 RepID=A0A1Q9AII9_9HYPH|nr:flagellar motor switch protein FliG [Xaviernesmea rhizosphaerae]OLP55066.1 flagellar motor switch protein FliG [Xaviernesmea rhizosphaerae]OQP83555.1 flagellar motor switch protein FliG [Xaviernesmea rhizosphaerae]